MAVLSKKQMSEEDIKLNFITPAIQPNWQGHITMETKITDGRINIKGNIVARSKPKFADYIQQGCVPAHPFVRFDPLGAKMNPLNWLNGFKCTHQIRVVTHFILTTFLLRMSVSICLILPRYVKICTKNQCRLAL